VVLRQGLGQFAVESVFDGELPSVLAVTLIVAVAITLANLVVGPCYAMLDPRVRLEARAQWLAAVWPAERLAMLKAAPRVGPRTLRRAAQLAKRRVSALAGRHAARPP
jgi:hypothetical protein